MKLKVLGSSSSGNCYVLANDNEALIIEAGKKLADIKVALGFNIRKVAACLVSHSHTDHAKYICDIVKVGIIALAPIEVFETSGLTGRSSFIRALESEKKYKAGNFTIVPFELEHDVRCFGYLIHHPETGTILFATDTLDIPYEFEGLNNMLIEANYCEEVVYQNIFDNKLNAAHQERVERSHMSIQRCLQFLDETDLSGVNNIVLIHLSTDNSNAESFLRQVQQATAKTVYIADKGLEIDFNKTPF